MASEFPGFYKIMLPLLDSSLKNQYQPIYFTQKTRYPKYQFKYYQMKGYHISDELLSEKIIDSIRPHAILLESSNEKEFFPMFRLMTSKEFDSCFEFFSKRTTLNNYFYTVGSIYEKKMDYVRAKEFLEKGCQQNEMFSLLKMIRILSEPILADKYQIKVDYNRSLNLILQNFMYNGLFDCFIPNYETFHGIYLLYLYMDCFSEMSNLAHEISLKNPLLKLFLTIKWENPEIYSILQEIESRYPENFLLLGDLYHPRILGVNIETEFNKMQDKYTRALRNDNKGWLKVASLNESFLNHELKKQSKSKTPNSILEESIKKINKNIDLAYKRLESCDEFSCNHELLHYQASNFNKKALEIVHLEHYRKLTQFGDDTILRVFFKVLKFQLKKTDQTSFKEELNNELFIIALKISHIDHEFKEAPLALCLEKGLGIQKNFNASFNLYRDILKKVISSGFEIHFFCYRLACLLKTAPGVGFEEYSNFFFQVAYWSLMSSINEEDYNGFYELGKMYLKGRGIEINEGYALKIYETLLRNVKERRRDSLNDQILIQLITRKIAKLKKSGSSAIKNINENESLKEFIINEKRNSNKIIKNWAIYKTLSSGSSITNEILNTMNILNDKLKGLNSSNEDWVNKIPLPFAKCQLPVIGSIKPKEMNKEINEAPKWKSSFKNSLKYSLEDFVNLIKNFLLKYVHCFELREIELNLNEHKTIGNHKLYPVKITHNNQIFSIKIIELGDLMTEQENILNFLDKLELYLKISSPYFLNINAFSLNLDKNLGQLYLYYENFSETLSDFIEQQDEVSDIKNKYFYWILFIIQTFQNSGYLFSYLTENHFVITKTFTPKLMDLDYDVLNKPFKQTLIIEQTKAITFHNLAKYSIPPELLYGIMKNNKSTLSTGSVVWSLGVIAFWLFARKQLFEGVELKNYDDFKIFYNQEKIHSKLENFILDQNNLSMMKILLNMNQQDRTNLNLSTLWSQNPQGIQQEFADENYLLINGFLHVNFDQADTQDQEIYLPHKEYFRGETTINLPNGRCQFNSGNLSMKGDFSKGKFIGNGEIFNTNASCILEFSALDSNQGIINGVLKKLSFSSEIEIPLSLSIYGMNLDEKIFEKFTTGFIKNEEIGWNNNLDIDDVLKWEVVAKYITTYKNFNKNQATKNYLIDNLIMYINATSEGNYQEFIQIKYNYISPYILIYDEKISSKNAFYISFFSFGLFQLAFKPNSKVLPHSLLQNINGVKYTFPGIKELGQFSDFDFQKGMRIKDFGISESLDLSKKVHFSRINNSITKEKYEGLKKDQIKWYQGVQIYENLIRYEGGYSDDKAYGKGVLTDYEGKIIYKGYFLAGSPSWGLLYKEKTKKYEGVFKRIGNFFADEIKSIEDIVNDFECSGIYLSPEEKIISTAGTFILKDQYPELTGYFNLIYETTNEYNGYLKQGVKKGLGCYNIKRDGSIHISIKGYWEANKVRAVIYWDSQNSFEKSIGNFSFNDNGNYIMQDYGTLFFKNGNKYEGFLSNNKLQGFGEFQQNVNGLAKCYRGEFLQSLRNGYGILEDSNLETKEKTIYIGIFQKNKKAGFGILKNNDILLLEGIFHDNSVKFGSLFFKNHPNIEKISANLMKKPNNSNEINPTGFGIVYLKDGRILECDVSHIVEDCLKEIKGKLILPKSNKIYEGTLKNLKPNGIGELYKNGKLLYAGEFLEGKFNGIGKLRSQNNKEYTGWFKNGLKEGFGIEYDLLENKRVFKGYWKNGMRNNNGILRNEENLNKKSFLKMRNNRIDSIIIEL